MMKHLAALVCALLLAGPAYAALEWTVGPELQLTEEPLAMVPSLDGQRLYVLTTKGTVLVLAADGRQEAEIPVGFEATSIVLSKDGKRLFLGDKQGKRIRQMALQERFSIPVGSSPSKGPADAAVAVVVFSDFQ